MFSPSLLSVSPPYFFYGSFPITTMTSADFLAHRNLIYSKTSPGKNIFLRPIPAESTYLLFFVFFGLHKDVLAYPNKYASYPVSVRQYRTLQSRFLQCKPYDYPPCDLLMLWKSLSTHKGLQHLGYLSHWIFILQVFTLWKIKSHTLRFGVNKIICTFALFIHLAVSVCTAHAGHTQGVPYVPDLFIMYTSSLGFFKKF